MPEAEIILSGLESWLDVPTAKLQKSWGLWQCCDYNDGNWKL